MSAGVPWEEDDYVKPCYEDLSYVLTSVDEERRRGRAGVANADLQARGTGLLSAKSSSGTVNARSSKRSNGEEHGNYDAYYGYRLRGQEDPRLAIIKPEW